MITPEYVAGICLYKALGGAQRNIYRGVAPNEVSSFPYTVYTPIFNNRTHDKDYTETLTNITYEVRIYGRNPTQVEEEANRLKEAHGMTRSAMEGDVVIGKASIIYDNEYDGFDQTTLLFTKVMDFKVRAYVS